MSDLVQKVADRPAPALPALTSRPVGRFLSDVAVMTGRSVRMSRRNLDALLTSLMLPIMLMVLFVYLFGGAIETGTRYVTYVVPGVLLLCAGYGSSLTAVTVSNDMTTGVVDRFRSMDISGAAVLAGHVVASVIRNLISTALVLGVAFLIGFRPHATVAGWISAAGLLVLYIVALSWFAAALGLLVSSPEAAAGFGFFVLFLPYPSSAFVPIDTMPSWIHGFATNQPVTPTIEAIRGYLVGGATGGHAWVAVIWALAILAVSVVAAATIFNRRAA